MIKNFVLDTNILLHSPSAMESGFDDNNVILTGTTLQELDRKKELGGEVGYNARESVRILDSLREKGDLRKGVKLDNGGTLFVEPNGVDQSLLPKGFDISVPDNRIISTCMYLNNNGKRITLVTNDVSMRVNASILGLKVEGYRNDQVEVMSYTGHTILETTPANINKLYEKGIIYSSRLTKGLLENEFITLKCGSQSALAVYHNQGIELLPEQKTFGGTKPLNAMQSYALWALRAPANEIPLVILIGAAGTAKTFLSLAAGLEDTYTSQKRGGGKYHKILLSRPNGVGFSNIGYLPGDIDQKLTPLMASYYDNMEILLGGHEGESREQIQMQMDDILATGVVEVCSLDFIRGRSLQDTYIICDEAQNSSRGLIRDVITRAGRGTKVVLAGDPGQIDVSALDKRSNGLVYAASKMAGSRYAAIVTFDSVHSVRSALAKEAIERMNF